MTLPNLLSVSRLLIGPALRYLAWTGNTALFFLFFVTSLLSDVADGYLARKLNQVSELGAQLDSWGDLAIYVTAPIGVWWLWPERIQPEAWARCKRRSRLRRRVAPSQRFTRGRPR